MPKALYTHSTMIAASTCHKLNGNWRNADMCTVPISVTTADYTVRVAWNESGLVVFFQVKDTHITGGTDRYFWEQTCAELFLAAQKGHQLGDERLFYDIFQCSICVSSLATTIGNDIGPSPFPRPLDIQRDFTEDGYELRIFLPWDTIPPIFADRIFRMQYTINRYDEEGHRTRFTLNDVPCPYTSTYGYATFRLCDGENPMPSLDLTWCPYAQTDTDGITIHVNRPDYAADVAIEFYNDSRELIQRIDHAQDTERLTNLTELTLHLIFIAYDANGTQLGTIEQDIHCLAAIMKRLAALDWKTLSPWERTWWLSIVSTVESIHLMSDIHNEATLLDQAILELKCRLAIIDGKPLPTCIPEKFELMNLARGFDAQLNISFSRMGWPSERHFSVLTVPWGNIPAAAAQIYDFASEKTAHEFMVSSTSFDQLLPIDHARFPGASAVIGARGWALCNGCRSDYLPKYHFSLYSPKTPTRVLRLSENELGKTAFDAICVLPDANENSARILRDLAAERGLPEIRPEEWNTYSHTLIVGKPDSLGINEFKHPSNGLVISLVYIRKGSIVYILSYDHPQIAERFWAFINAGKPITTEIARELACLKADTLPESSPADAALAWRLRLGDNHTHTVASDGKTTPLGSLTNAPIAGYDYLCITDHNRTVGGLWLEEALKRARCTYPLFTGVEVTLQPKYHLNIYPVSKNIENDYTITAIRQFAKEEDAILQLNHPMTIGTNFADLWYGDFTLAGFDAVERFVAYRDKWQKNHVGKIPASTGASDTHNGIFGYLDATVIDSEADPVTKDSLKKAIRSSACAMLDSFTPSLVYGNEDIRRAVAYLLRSPEAPARFGDRIKLQFRDFAPEIIIPEFDVACTYEGTTRPKEAYCFDEPDTLTVIS